jgi:3-deoxy-manno-octulosonate cytidylyltransferase (CMP-KDO synthetase)
MDILLAIPARYGSSRFEGKPLIDFKGKTMIQRVVEQCQKVGDLFEGNITVIVGTDDQRIYNHVKQFGEVMMTSDSHESGTDRVAEVAAKSGKSYDAVINVQGDEPLIFPEQIVQLIDCFMDPGVTIATLIRPVTYTDDLSSPNIVKCIVDHKGEAIYFSRHLIPFYRGVSHPDGLLFNKHIGMYGFRPATLSAVTALPQSFLEKAECLEQLRWIENGYAIQTAVSHYESIAVDSPDDVARVMSRL